MMVERRPGLDLGDDRGAAAELGNFAYGRPDVLGGPDKRQPHVVHPALVPIHRSPATFLRARLDQSLRHQHKSKDLRPF